jgi:hypothetical protein
MCMPVSSVYKEMHVIVLYIASKFYLFLIKYKLTVCGHMECLRHSF